MDKENIIAYDVDFVLLCWVSGVEPFLREKGIDSSHLEKLKRSTYYPKLQEIFLIDDEDKCINLMKEYNSSPHIANLPVFEENSIDTLHENKRNGVGAVAVTCVGAEHETRFNRMLNLQKIYGKDLFKLEDVIAIPVRTSKEPYLKKLQEKFNVLGFIDDRVGHLSEAINLGIPSILYTNNGNKPSCDTTVVMNTFTELPELTDKLIEKMYSRNEIGLDKQKQEAIAHKNKSSAQGFSR